MNLVLLVNDNEEVRDRTAAMLTELGWEVFLADSEKLVLESAELRPTIMIIDVEMRDGIGFESISTARRLFEDIFIIAVTRAAATRYSGRKLQPRAAPTPMWWVRCPRRSSTRRFRTVSSRGRSAPTRIQILSHNDSILGVGRSIQPGA
ncbi:MAG: response regulator [Woeseiaceae bacterium]